MRARTATAGIAVARRPPVTADLEAGALTSTLTPERLVVAMRAFSEALELHRDTVNRLNVYPVPDGDTGTNMALTVDSVVKALDGIDLEAGRRRPDGRRVPGDLERIAHGCPGQFGRHPLPDPPWTRRHIRLRTGGRTLRGGRRPARGQRGRSGRRHAPGRRDDADRRCRRRHGCPGRRRTQRRRRRERPCHGLRGSRASCRRVALAHA